MSRAANTVVQQSLLHARGGVAYLLCSFIQILRRGHHFLSRWMRLIPRHILWQTSSTLSCNHSLHKTLPADRTRQTICRLSSLNAPDWVMCFCRNRAIGVLFLVTGLPLWIQPAVLWCVLVWRGLAKMTGPGTSRLRRLLVRRQCPSEIQHALCTS